MTSICPTVLATDATTYRQQMERIARFAHRVHIDLADGQFAPEKTIPINEVWWPGGVRADLHVMHRKPFEHLDELIALGPQLIIVHAEADGDFEQFAKTVHNHSIETGVALLPKTAPKLLKSAIDFVDHVLIFSGDLGHFGGQADLALLNKVQALKIMKPTLEIGWDGGVNDQNASRLMAGGVDVLNAGGFIQKAQDPSNAFEKLIACVKG